MSEELKLCPFCGGEAEIKKQGKLYGIVCNREPCLNSGLLFSFTQNNYRNAIKAWNTRHTEKPQDNDALQALDRIYNDKARFKSGYCNGSMSAELANGRYVLVMEHEYKTIRKALMSINTNTNQDKVSDNEHKALKLLAKIEKGELAVVPVKVSFEMLTAYQDEMYGGQRARKDAGGFMIRQLTAAIKAAPPLEELLGE